jgi:hypothetical protein
MFRCIDTIFRESFLVYVEVIKLQSFVTSAIIKKDSLNYVNTSKQVAVLYRQTDITVNILCIVDLNNN